MSEHFTFEQRLGDTAQVHFHKWLLGSWTVAVYGFGYQFFSRSTFPGNQYRSVGLGNPFDSGQYIHECLALADDVAAVELSFFLLLLFLFLLLVVQCKGCLDVLHQNSIVPRFGNEIESTGLHAFHGQLDASPSRHEDDRCFRLEYLDLLQESDAFVARCGEREVHVHEDEFRGYGAYYGYRFLGRGNGLNIVLGPLQHKTEGGTDSAIVVDYQYHRLQM